MEIDASQKLSDLDQTFWSEFTKAIELIPGKSTWSASEWGQALLNRMDIENPVQKSASPKHVLVSSLDLDDILITSHVWPSQRIESNRDKFEAHGVCRSY